MEVKSVLCHFCHTNCRLNVSVEDGRIVKLAGDKNDLISRGFICERAANAAKWLYHKDQLQYPLKRVGARGQGKWQRIGWDQALDEIAGKLADIKARDGAESLVFAEGTYRNDCRWARPRFANLFGCPQNECDSGNVSWLMVKTVGVSMAGGVMTPTGAVTECVVFWGMNLHEAYFFIEDKIKPMLVTQEGFAKFASRLTAPMMSFLIKHPPLAHRIWKAFHRLPRRPRKGKEPGFKLLPRKPKIIVIDPRRTKLAEHADMFLQIRPGTDAALALGWLNVIIAEGLYDRRFVDKWCHGFAELAERVKEYTPDKVARITDLTEQQIVESARIYGSARPGMFMTGMSLMQSGWNAARLEQARVSLAGICGNLDRFGGNELHDFPVPADLERGFMKDQELELWDKLPVEQRSKQFGADRFRLITFPGWLLNNEHSLKLSGLPMRQAYGIRSHPPTVHRAVLTGRPHPARAQITWISNPVMNLPNAQLVMEAYQSPNLELHVVLDFWMTPTAALADYVLPSASWMERPFCAEAMVGLSGLVVGEPAVAPLGERRHDYEFWAGLGRRLGQEEHWPWKTYDEVIAHRLHRTGLTFEELLKRGGLVAYPRHYHRYRKQGFATPTRKLELKSTVFETLGYDPLPSYREPPETSVSRPDLAQEFPYTLIAGTRFRPLYATEHRQLGLGLRERYPDPLAELHVKTAARHGIADRDWIFIETPRGRIKHRAKLSETIREDTVSVQLGWWFPERPAELPSLFGALECNANVLTLDDPDLAEPMCGGWYNHAILCKVYKVPEEK